MHGTRTTTTTTKLQLKHDLEFMETNKDTYNKNNEGQDRYN
jgi:hypothetical protein